MIKARPLAASGNTPTSYALPTLWAASSVRPVQANSGQEYTQEGLVTALNSAKRIFRRYLSLHGSDMSQEYLTGTIPDRIHAAPARLHMHIDKDLSAFGVYAARI